MKRNILVTGGAGFIGKCLINKLVMSEPSSCIWVFDNLHHQIHGDLPHDPKFIGNVNFIKADITDKQAIHEAIIASQPEIVYHLAAETGTGQSYNEITRYCDVNVMGTANLVESIRLYSTVTKKIILATSRAVYGEGAYRDKYGNIFPGQPRQDSTMSKGDFSVELPRGALLPAKPVPVTSELALSPASIYASTKLMQEYILKQSGEKSVWNAVLLRFQNVYGPGQTLRNPYTGVLSIFARQLLEGKKISIYEDGLITRDFVFVDDVVNSLICAGLSHLPHGKTIDIGSGEAITIKDVAKMLIKILSCGEDSYTITGDFRVGDIRYACADISEAKRLLSWAPKVNIETGLALFADWAKSEFKSNNL